MIFYFLLFIGANGQAERGQLSPEEISTRLEVRQKFVAEVNKRAKYWKAEMNSDFALFDMEMKRMMQGSKSELWEENQKFGGQGARALVPKKVEEDEPELKFYGYAEPETFATLSEGPENGNDLSRAGAVCKDFRFDSREKWPECAHVIGTIRDQSLCSSCYAVSTASAFSDRFCIAMAKRGMAIFEEDSAFLSAADVMDCARAGDGNACAGGYSSKAWKFFTDHGVVTGHGYKSGGCKPYPIAPYQESLSNSTNCREQVYWSSCPQNCSNPRYGKSYGSDKKMALNYNVIGTLRVPKAVENNNTVSGMAQEEGKQPEFSWEQTMKEELLHNGSITVDYRVFDDFFDYPQKGGIYQHVHGEELNPHVVRVIGYGKVNCTDGASIKYWLVANSWGRRWGDFGLFRIARGVDECGIESRQIGFGTPKLALDVKELIGTRI